MVDLSRFRDWFWAGTCVRWGHVKKPNPAPRGGRTGRKNGRDKVKCARYRAEGRRERNKARRAAKIARQAAKKAATPRQY